MTTEVLTSEQVDQVREALEELELPGLAPGSWIGVAGSGHKIQDVCPIAPGPGNTWPDLMMTTEQLPATYPRQPNVRDVIEDEKGLYLGDLLSVSQTKRVSYVLKVGISRNPRILNTDPRQLLWLAKGGNFTRAANDILDEIDGADEDLRFINELFEEYHRDGPIAVQVYDGDPSEMKLEEFSGTAVDVARIIHLVETNKWKDKSPWSLVYRLFRALGRLRDGA